MPRFKDQAICIRHIDWSETSQIVALLTQNHGKLPGLAKGSKRTSPSSVARYSGGIELLTAGQIVGLTKPTAELATLTEWDLQHPYWHLRHHLGAQQLALYGVDLANALLADHDPHPNAFHALAQFLDQLADPDQHARALLDYQWQLLEDTGYRPQLDRDVRTGTLISPDPSPNGHDTTHTDTTQRKWYTFDPHAGGLTTQASDLENGTWRVRVETVHLLRSLTGRHDAPPTPATELATIDRANRLLCSYARAVLDRQLPTMRFVLDPESSAKHSNN